MLIDVYPSLRLPRRFGAFTYHVPEGMDVAVGSLVRVVFRGRSVHAIVAEIHERSMEGKKVADITEVIPGWAFTPGEIECLKEFALEAIQSVSSIVHAILPSLPKRSSKRSPSFAAHNISLSVSKIDADAIQAMLPSIEKATSLFIESPDLRRTAALIATARKRIPGPWTVCAPNVRDAKLLVDVLATAEPVMVTGEGTPIARERAWRAFRANPNGLLIGTSIASLMTHPAGGVLALARSSHENHRREDRNPRFDARRNATIRSKLQAGAVLYFDAFPRIDELEQAERLSPFPLYPTTLADMRANRGHRAHPLISPEADEAIVAAIEANTRVLIAFNRTAKASELPQRILPAGIRPRKTWTVGSLAKELGEAFSCSAASAEKGVDRLPAASIVVTTSHYLENLFNPFTPDGFGAVIEIGADQPLRDANPRALERALGMTAQWRAVAQANHATFVIQTDAPDLFRLGLSDPSAGLKEEASARKAYGYPPFGRAASIDQLPGTHGLTEHLPEGVRCEPHENGYMLMYPNDLMKPLHQFLAPLPDSIRIDTTQFS